MIPTPRLRIDGFAYRTEQAERLATASLHRRFAIAHQRAQRRGRGVEDVHLMPVYNIPETAIVGIAWNALEDQTGRAILQRPVNDIAVPCDPADVGRAEEDFSRLIIENIMEGGRRPHRIAAGRMEHTLRLSSGTRSVENEQRVFCIHWLARAVSRHIRRIFMI